MEYLLDDVLKIIIKNLKHQVFQLRLVNKKFNRIYKIVMSEYPVIVLLRDDNYINIRYMSTYNLINRFTDVVYFSDYLYGKKEYVKFDINNNHYIKFCLSDHWHVYDFIEDPFIWQSISIKLMTNNIISICKNKSSDLIIYNKFNELITNENQINIITDLINYSYKLINNIWDSDSNENIISECNKLIIKLLILNSLALW